MDGNRRSTSLPNFEDGEIAEGAPLNNYPRQTGPTRNGVHQAGVRPLQPPLPPNNLMRMASDPTHDIFMRDRTIDHGAVPLIRSSSYEPFSRGDVSDGRDIWVERERDRMGWGPTGNLPNQRIHPHSPVHVPRPIARDSMYHGQIGPMDKDRADREREWPDRDREWSYWEREREREPSRPGAPTRGPPSSSPRWVGPPAVPPSTQDCVVGARPRDGDPSRTGWCERDVREREFIRERDGGLVGGDWGAVRWAAGPQAGWPPLGNNSDLRTREGGPAPPPPHDLRTREGGPGPPPPHDLRRDGHLNDRRDLIATGALGPDLRVQGLEARPRRDVNDTVVSSGSHPKAFAPPPPPPLPPGPAPVPPPPIDKPPPDRFSPERVSSRDKAKPQAKPPPPPPPSTQPHAVASAFPPPHNSRFGPAPVAPSATSCMDEVMEDLSVRSPGSLGPPLGLCPPMDKGGLQATPDVMMNLQRNYFPEVALGFDKGVMGMNLVAVSSLRPGLGVPIPPLLAPPPPPSSPPRDHPTSFAQAPHAIPSLVVPLTSSTPPMPSAPPPPPPPPPVAFASNISLAPAEANTSSSSSLLLPPPTAPPVSTSTPLILVVSSTGSESPTASVEKSASAAIVASPSTKGSSKHAAPSKGPTAAAASVSASTSKGHKRDDSAGKKGTSDVPSAKAKAKPSCSLFDLAGGALGIDAATLVDALPPKIEPIVGLGLPLEKAGNGLSTSLPSVGISKVLFERDDSSGSLEGLSAAAESAATTTSSARRPRAAWGQGLSRRAAKVSETPREIDGPSMGADVVADSKSKVDVVDAEGSKSEGAIATRNAPDVGIGDASGMDGISEGQLIVSDSRVADETSGESIDGWGAKSDEASSLVDNVDHQKLKLQVPKAARADTATDTDQGEQESAVASSRSSSHGEALTPVGPADVDKDDADESETLSARSPKRKSRKASSKVERASEKVKGASPEGEAKPGSGKAKSKSGHKSEKASAAVTPPAVAPPSRAVGSKGAQEKAEKGGGEDAVKEEEDEAKRGGAVAAAAVDQECSVAGAADVEEASGGESSDEGGDEDSDEGDGDSDSADDVDTLGAKDDDDDADDDDDDGKSSPRKKGGVAGSKGQSAPSRKCKAVIGGAGAVGGGSDAKEQVDEVDATVDATLAAASARKRRPPNKLRGDVEPEAESEAPANATEPRKKRPRPGAPGNASGGRRDEGDKEAKEKDGRGTKTDLSTSKNPNRGKGRWPNKKGEAAADVGLASPVVEEKARSNDRHQSQYVSLSPPPVRRHTEADRATLGQVFSSQEDLDSAFQLLRMLRVFEANSMAGVVNMAAVTAARQSPFHPQALAFPLPHLADLTSYLDLIDKNETFLTDKLTELRAGQVFLETMIDSLTTSEEDDYGASASAVAVEHDQRGGHLNTSSLDDFCDVKPSSGGAGRSVARGQGGLADREATLRSSSDSQAPSSSSKTKAATEQMEVEDAARVGDDTPHAPASASVEGEAAPAPAAVRKKVKSPIVPAVVGLIHAQNQIHVTEACLVHTVSRPSRRSHTSAGGSDNVSTSTASSAGHGNVESMKTIINEATYGLLPLYLSPEDSPMWQATVDKMEALRPAMTREIRRRKLQRRRAWEILGESYLTVRNMWNRHMEAVEQEDDWGEREGPRLRGSTVSAGAQRSINGEVGGGSNRSSSRLSGASTAASGLGGAGHGAFSSSYRTSDVIRSDYDQDRLLEQLASTESMKARIKKGAATMVNMQSPWVDADRHKAPSRPVWPKALREFVVMPTMKRLGKSNKLFGDGAAGGAGAEAGENDEDPEDGGIAGTEKQREEEGDDEDPITTPFPGYVPGPIQFIDTRGSCLTTDGRKQICSYFEWPVPCPPFCNCALQVDKQQRFESIWTDVEKSIFVDKFLQYPKNFSKIAAYLTNRSVKDCIKFYYDSKAVINYKGLMKEFENRRRSLRNHNPWAFAVAGARSVGCSLYAPWDPDEKEPHVELPVDDATYHAFLSHPPHTKRALGATEPRSRSRNLLTRKRWLTTLQMDRRDQRLSDSDDDDDDDEVETSPAPQWTSVGPPSTGTRGAVVGLQGPADPAASGSAVEESAMRASSSSTPLTSSAAGASVAIAPTSRKSTAGRKSRSRSDVGILEGEDAVPVEGGTGTHRQSHGAGAGRGGGRGRGRWGDRSRSSGPKGDNEDTALQPPHTSNRKTRESKDKEVKDSKEVKEAEKLPRSPPKVDKTDKLDRAKDKEKERDKAEVIPERKPAVSAATPLVSAPASSSVVLATPLLPAPASAPAVASVPASNAPALSNVSLESKDKIGANRGLVTTDGVADGVAAQSSDDAQRQKSAIDERATNAGSSKGIEVANADSSVKDATSDLEGSRMTNFPTLIESTMAADVLPVDGKDDEVSSKLAASAVSSENSQHGDSLNPDFPSENGALGQVVVDSAMEMGLHSVKRQASERSLNDALGSGQEERNAFDDSVDMEHPPKRSKVNGDDPSQT